MKLYHLHLLTSVLWLLAAILNAINHYIPLAVAQVIASLLCLVIFIYKRKQRESESSPKRKGTQHYGKDQN